MKYKPFTTDSTDEIINDIKYNLSNIETSQISIDTLDVCHLLGKIERLNNIINKAINILELSAMNKGICTRPETDTIQSALLVLKGSDKELLMLEELCKYKMFLIKLLDVFEDTRKQVKDNELRKWMTKICSSIKNILGSDKE